MSDETQEYWLVYLWDPETDKWTAVGLTEDRDQRDEWWLAVQRGEIELPERFDGWWCSDRPVSVGLTDGDGGVWDGGSE